MIFAVTFLDMNNNLVILSTTTGMAIYCDKADAHQMLFKTSSELKYKLDGSPRIVGLSFFQREIKLKVSEVNKNLWTKILNTLDVKQIAELKFTDNTCLSSSAG